VKLQATKSGEWPPGIHWTAGEVCDVPAGYPGADQDPPAWLTAPTKRKATKAKTPKAD